LTVIITINQRRLKKYPKAPSKKYSAKQKLLGRLIMKKHVKAVGLLLLALVIVWGITGCGPSGTPDPNAEFITALQEIDLSDGGEGGELVESSFTSQSLGTINGVLWRGCHFDQVKTSKQLVAVTNNSTTAIGTVNFTVTGYCHVKITITATSIPTDLEAPFSVSGMGTVYFNRNANGRWRVDSFKVDPLK
jgi:hypothetical protein